MGVKMHYMSYLLGVDVYLDTTINDILFTGKLVKSLLIDANPQLKEVFAKVRGIQPKLIHITPLYEISNGKIKCLYSYAIVDMKNRIVKKYKTILRSGVYRFYIGFIEDDVNGAVNFDAIYNTLLNISGLHRFRRHNVKIDLVSIDIINIYTHIRNLVKELLRSKGKLRIIFSSPTLLRDPLRMNKQKSLIPTPMNIFSTPVYITSYLLGELKRKTIIETLVLLHRLLNEPYSIYNTVSIKWVIYDKSKQPIPTITGYVNLHLNETYYESYSKKLNIEELLEKIFTITSTLGTGTSRAAGFGHTILQLSNHSNGWLPKKSEGISKYSKIRLINPHY